MSVSIRGSSDRDSAIKRFKLEDGREIRYRSEAERQLIEETQRLQISLQSKPEDDAPKRIRR